MTFEKILIDSSSTYPIKTFWKVILRVFSVDIFAGRETLPRGSKMYFKHTYITYTLRQNSVAPILLPVSKNLSQPNQVGILIVTVYLVLSILPDSVRTHCLGRQKGGILDCKDRSRKTLLICLIQTAVASYKLHLNQLIHLYTKRGLWIFILWT